MKNLPLKFSNSSIRRPKLASIFPLVVIFTSIWWLGWPYWNENFTPGAALEEQALVSISADNIRADFLQNWGTANYGLNGPGLTSDKMLYTHFPSGPDLILAILRSFKLSEDLIRHSYILIAITSIAILFSLLTKLRLQPTYIGLILSFFVFNYSAFWSYSDHFVYAFYFPLLFSGIICLLKIIRREKYGYLFFQFFLFVSYLTTFINFFTLATAAFIIALSCKSERKKILLTTSLSACTLFFFHFLRNCLALGINVASQDLLYTAGNRILGFPTKSSVSGFFRENQVAWWGTDNTSLYSLYRIGVSTFNNHLGLIITIAFVICRGLVRVHTGTSVTKSEKRLNESQILIIVAASSLVWYLLFPHQGKNYYFPPIFHSFALLSIIGCVLFFESENIAPKNDLKSLKLTKLKRLLVLYLLIIPSFSIVNITPNTWLKLSVNVSTLKTVLFFAFFYSFFLMHQLIISRYTTKKTFLFFTNALLSLSAFFSINLIEIFSSLKFSSPSSKIFFVFGLFLISNFIFDFYTEFNKHNLGLTLLRSGLIALTVINSLSLFQRNIHNAQEALSQSFYSSDLRSFKELPKLTGNIWTNINAPLLFRYTGGNVIGYCQSQGLLQNDKKYCASGRVNHEIDNTSQTYVILVENFASGDFACFVQDPCFDELIKRLEFSHKKINSPPGFHIYEKSSN